jgi:PAS domain S-box-containing protein
MTTGSLPERQARPTPGHGAPSEDQLLALIDNIAAVMYMRDLDGRYMLVNREYERLFHLHRDAIVGLTDHDLFSAEIADEFRANDLQAVLSGGPVQVEEVAPGENGLHTYITVKFPLLDSAGHAYAVGGISTDVTDRKRAEEQVMHRTAELEASTRELDAFAYSVSHDLRAPLRALHGFSQVLLEDYEDRLDDDGRQYLRRIQANVDHMGQLIDDLLRLSHVTRTGLKRERTDIGALAGEIIAGLRDAEPHRHVEVTIADDLATICDSHLIRAALDNLLANAWKFTSKREHAIIDVGAVHQHGTKVFFVRDNGAGFDMRYAGKLFDPFQRLHAAADFEGTGIGLAIVNRILGRHGGEIWAESEPEMGARFFFTLTPRSNDREGEP